MENEYQIKLYQRPNAQPPNKPIVDGVYEIAKSLTSKWFTANVPDEVLHDLQFHDVFCLHKADEILSFLVFTSWDGMMYISLMGTRPEFQGKGLGSKLIERFFQYTRGLGFESVAVLTIPEEYKPIYGPTIRFYEKHGFKVIRRSTFWENGALHLIKKL